MMVNAITETLDRALKADDASRREAIHQLAATPAESMDALIEVLCSPIKRRWALAAEVLGAIGYPRNAPAIPVLIGHVGGLNSPDWPIAVNVLQRAGASVVVPELTRALLTLDRTVPYWGEAVEGMCWMLRQIGGAFAVQVGPTVAYLLATRPSPDELDVEALIGVLEVVGNQSAHYALPVLISLLAPPSELESDVRARVRHLIEGFAREDLEPYRTLLASLGAG